jgi:DNA processing protein
MFFPERNRIMSALANATIIVEAGTTSGTKTQARAAIDQGRKLLILDSVISPGNWAHKFLAEGAIRIKDEQDLERALLIDDISENPQCTEDRTSLFG